MPRIPVLVVGAGQAGLAVSHLLTGAGVGHVVLERGRTAERWDAHTRESLRLLSPNWLSRLPGYSYTGPDPDGFMSAREVAGYLRSYAAWSAAPVVEGADVVSVRGCADGFRVLTTAGAWTAAAVVLATGWCDVPHLPALSAGIDPRIEQFSPAGYRHPSLLPDGGVLVVGAGATGVQLADELACAGRNVLLAVGSHTRLPRRYRGRDIMWWLDALGILDRPLDEDPEAPSVRREPSPQLVGCPDGRDVDLRALRDRGVGLVGRLAGADGARVHFADDLPETTGRADARLRSLLRRIDAYAVSAGLAGGTPDPTPRGVPAGALVRRLDLLAAGIRTVIWATGYRRDYRWLHVPVLDRAGNVRHSDGATAAPGLHVAGMRWQSRRSSATLDGVRHDAETVVSRVLDHLGARAISGRAA